MLEACAPKRGLFYIVFYKGRCYGFSRADGPFFSAIVFLLFCFEKFLHIACSKRNFFHEKSEKDPAAQSPDAAAGDQMQDGRGRSVQKRTDHKQNKSDEQERFPAVQVRQLPDPHRRNAGGQHVDRKHPVKIFHSPSSRKRYAAEWRRQWFG